MAAKKDPRASETLADRLRQRGLAKYPGAHTKSPWPGHLDLAVKDKTFVYLSVPGEPFSISCKLPRSQGLALTLPNTRPTAYGLGKSGWVTLTGDDRLPPIDVLEAWIDESYRAQAPKKLVAQLDAGSSTTAPPAQEREARKPTTKKNVAAKMPPKRTTSKVAKTK